MDPLERPEVRWGLGCLLSAVAITGILILVLLLAILVQPPAWVQIVVGVAMVGGAVIFAWILATALGRARTGSRVDSDPPRTDPDLR